MSDNKDGGKEIDKELSDLMDSALKDMTKTQTNQETSDSNVQLNPEAMLQNMWSEEFLKEAASQFQNNMAALIGNVNESDPDQQEIAQTFNKMAEAAAKILQPNANPVSAVTEDPAAQTRIDEVSAAISQTLQNLNQNSETLQTPFTDQDLMSMFGNFNPDSSGQDSGNMFVPFMQGMMQSLLSKEVLYPSLKELIDKYPAWLEENKGKIQDSEYERYRNQMLLMEKVCAELEPESEADSEEVKRKRFEKVLELMQKMQDLGQPPTELVGDIGPGIPMSAADNSQCSIM